MVTWPIWKLPQNQIGRHKKAKYEEPPSAAAKNKQYPPSDDPEEHRSDDCHKQDENV